MMQRMKHKIRQAYGYTDEQIYNQILRDGGDWAIDAYQLIMEDENTYWQTMIATMPLARTPMDKKFSKSLQTYSKSLRKSIEKVYAPWIEAKRIEAIKERLSKPPKGVVVDESGNVIDVNDPEWWKKIV